MNVGFHGKDPDMSDSADAEVVRDLPGGQFDLLFCSLGCHTSLRLRILQHGFYAGTRGLTFVVGSKLAGLVNLLLIQAVC